MNKIHTLLYYAFALCSLSVSLLIQSCSSDDNIVPASSSKAMCFTAYHPSSLATRASFSDFEKDDRIGVFVYSDTTTLQLAGNDVSNEPFTFNGSQWDARRELSWNEGTYNVRAYYPHSTVVNSIEDCRVSVATDQSLGRGEFTSPNTDALLSAYEASDILFAEANGIAATNSAVPLYFRHTMSRLVIRLIKGEDYKGDLPKDLSVYVHSTVTEATLNLNNGTVTKDIRAPHKSIKARQESDYTYAAIIVPQRITTRSPLVEVEVNGTSFLYESMFNFKPGTQHIINFIIDKNPDQSIISIGGEMAGW